MKYYILIFLLPQLLLSGCVSNKNLRVADLKISKSGINFDSEWSNTLLMNRDIVKKEWLSVFQNDLDYIKERFDVSLKQNDIDNLVFIPHLCYLIDSISLLELNEKTSIKKMLKINNENAYYFVLKDNVLTFDIYLEYVNSKWNLISWGRVSDSLSKKFSEIFNQKKLPFLDIGIKPNEKYIRHYNVFLDDNLELMNLSVDGAIRPFRDVLFEFNSGN